MLDLSKIKADFSNLVSEAQPWTLTQFVMWLDLKLSEYKIKGYMVLDYQTTTKPRWLNGEENNGGDIVPQPPSCRTCHHNQDSLPRSDSYSQSHKRKRDSNNVTYQTSRQEGESYISEVLSVGENVRGGYNSKKAPTGTVISLEPATDLTVEELEEVNNVMSSGAQLHRNPQRQQMRNSSATVTSSERGYAKASNNRVSGSFSIHDNQNTDIISQQRQNVSFPRQPARTASPPKRQLAMVDLSQATIPGEESSYDSMSLPTGNSDFTNTGSTDVDFIQTHSTANETKAVPVSLHANIETTRGGQESGEAVTMETMSSIIASEIKQEIDQDISFDSSSNILSGTEDSMNQMYLVGDNSLSDSEANYSQSYSPGSQVTSQQMTMGKSQIYTVNEQEVDLPKFEDPLVRRVLEDGGTPSRNMWSRIITRCAYHMLAKGVPHKHDYQLFSKAFYMRYPCIGTNRGPNPWSIFAKTLSQKVRYIRWQTKNTNSPAYRRWKKLKTNDNS